MDWPAERATSVMDWPRFSEAITASRLRDSARAFWAMAQTAGILLNKVLKSEGKVAFYLGVDGAKFRRMVVPGDQLRMEIKFLKLRLGMAQVSGRALVDGELACEATMMFGGGK